MNYINLNDSMGNFKEKDILLQLFPRKSDTNLHSRL